MEASFQLEISDWKAFLKVVGSGNGVRAVGLGVALVMMVAHFFIGLLAPMGYVLLLAFIALLTVILGGLKFHRKPQFSSPITIKANAEGVSGTSINGRDTFFWPAIEKIVETDAHFFILNEPRGGFIVPKRAFDSPENAERFAAFLRENWSKNQKTTAPIAPPQ